MTNASRVANASPIANSIRTGALVVAICAAHVVAQAPHATRAQWGTTPGGDTVWQYTLANRRGTTVRAITLGAIITNILVRDRDGKLDDVVLGMSDVEGYLTKSPYFGAIAGRYANRIARGRFTLDGTTYTLAINNGPNHLHGGVVGFDKRIWTARAVQNDSGAGVAFSLTSADGDQGYPGELRVTARYLLTDDDRLVVDYRAVTSKPTVVNLTQHSYFNLAGAKRDDILGHVLTVDADRYVPVDSTLIPLGQLASVAGTPFDFRRPTAVGARIAANDEQLRRAGGYDHSFVVRRTGPGLVHAAQLFDPLTGRTLDVWTTEPAVQVYTGNFLDGTVVGKGGRAYPRRGAVCLETTHLPDTPNHPSFPSATLRPGDVFTSRTVYAFRGAMRSGLPRRKETMPVIMRRGIGVTAVAWSVACLSAASVAAQAPRPAGATRSMLTHDSVARVLVAPSADSVVRTRADHVRTGAKAGFITGGVLGFLYPWPWTVGCATTAVPNSGGANFVGSGCSVSSILAYKFVVAIGLGLGLGAFGAGVGSLVGLAWPVQERK